MKTFFNLLESVSDNKLTEIIEYVNSLKNKIVIHGERPHKDYSERRNLDKLDSLDNISQSLRNVSVVKDVKREYKQILYSLHIARDVLKNGKLTKMLESYMESRKLPADEKIDKEIDKEIIRYKNNNQIAMTLNRSIKEINRFVQLLRIRLFKTDRMDWFDLINALVKVVSKRYQDVDTRQMLESDIINAVQPAMKMLFNMPRDRDSYLEDLRKKLIEMIGAYEDFVTKAAIPNWK